MATSEEPSLPASPPVGAARASVEADGHVAEATETKSRRREPAAVGCGRGTDAECPARAAGVVPKERTEELTGVRRSWRRRLNKNRVNTFTFKLVSASCGDPRALNAGGQSTGGGYTRALQRVVPPNALRKNRYAKQLPRELLETFNPEDFGIHANLDEDVRRQLCDEIYGDEADLLKEKEERARLLNQERDTEQQDDAVPRTQRDAHSSSLHSSDLDDDCYFPKDGYDYTQHLVPIRGEVYSTTKKAQAAEAVKSTVQSQEQETQQAPKPAAAAARSREECHVLEALENADDYEQLLDDFVAAAQTDETGHVQPIEGEEALLWGESHTAGAERHYDAISEHLEALRLQDTGTEELGEDELQTESSDVGDLENSDSDDASADGADGGADRVLEAGATSSGGLRKQAAAARAAAPTDEDFEKVLEEYGDEYIGEVEAEGEEACSSASEQEKLPSDVEEALDEFLLQQKRGNKLHIFTREFLKRRSTRRLAPEAAAAAAAVAGESHSASHHRDQHQKRGGHGGRSSSSSDEEEVKGDRSRSDEEEVKGDELESNEEGASAAKEEGSQELPQHKKYPHKEAAETDVHEMFKRLSKAEVQVIKTLAEQQERERQERLMRRGEDCSTDEEMKERVRREEERRWDCETILTTRSALSWIPRTIALPPPHILKKQLHLLRGTGAGRCSAQGDDSRNVKLLPQLGFPQDATSAAARAGRRGLSSVEGQQQGATSAKEHLRGKRQQGGLGLPSSHVFPDEDAHEHANTSGGSTAEGTPAANANDTVRLVAALQNAPDADIPAYVLTHRPRGETTEERRERKKAVKETQRLAREVKKQNKLLLKEEEKKAASRRMNTNAYDLKAGVRCVKF